MMEPQLFDLVASLTSGNLMIQCVGRSLEAWGLCVALIRFGCLRCGIAEKPPLCKTDLMQSQRWLPDGRVVFLLGLQDSVSHLSALVRSGVICLGLRLRVVVLVPMRVCCS